MEISYFNGETFSSMTYLEALENDWKDDESFHEFLGKSGFCKNSDIFGGFISIYSRTSESKLPGFFIDINHCETCQHFFVINFIDLIKFLKFFGVNYYQEMYQKNVYMRIINVEDVETENYNCISMVMLPQEKVLITSDDEILTAQERSRRIRERREKRESKKKEEELKKSSDI